MSSSTLTTTAILTEATAAATTLLSSSSTSKNNDSQTVSSIGAETEKDLGHREITPSSSLHRVSNLEQEEIFGRGSGRLQTQSTTTFSNLGDPVAFAQPNCHQRQQQYPSDISFNKSSKILTDISRSSKMDRVFTQSGGSVGVGGGPRFMRNRTYAAGNGPRGQQPFQPQTRPDFLMVSGNGAPGQPMMYGAGPEGVPGPISHIRTISGSGNIDEYDYQPSFGRQSMMRSGPPGGYRYFNRNPARMNNRRFRGPPRDDHRMIFDDDMPRMPRRSYRRPRIMDDRPMYHDEPPFRYRRGPPRRSYRNDFGNNEVDSDYIIDDVPIGRRRNESGRYPTSTGPSQMQKPVGMRDRPLPRRRRRSSRQQSQSASRRNNTSSNGMEPQANAVERPSQTLDDSMTARRRRRVRRRRRTTTDGNSASAAGGNGSGGAGAAAAHKQQSESRDMRQGRRRGRSASTGGPNGRRFSCSLCRQSFRTAPLRLRHMRLFHARRRRRDFICKQCRGVFINARSITVHLNQPHSQDKQPEVNARRAPVGAPIRYLPENAKIFECKFCPFSFGSAAEAESHQSRCRASQPMKVSYKLEYPGNDQFIISCFCCPELLSIRENMIEHFTCLHPFVDLSIIYYCAICSKEFDTEANVSKHIELDHKDQGKPELEEIKSLRAKEFLKESLKSYEIKRPVPMPRLKNDVRLVVNRLVRQTVRLLRPSQAGGNPRANRNNQIPSSAGSVVVQQPVAQQQ